MLYNAKNRYIDIDGTKMHYAVFGNGSKKLVIIPGLAIRDIKGAALELAFMYRMFTKKYTVYIFDKKEVLPDTYTVRDIAADTAKAMMLLGIENADIIGISQGGMVAQYLAVDYPHLVLRLVLGVTASRSNDTLKEVIGRWLSFAENGDFKSMNLDSFKAMFSEKYLKKYRLLLPFACKIKPKNPARFITLTRACLTCNAYDELDKITCPTLVIGGRLDKVVTPEASYEIAEKLGCEIYMYDDFGHSAYDEARDFNKRIFDFLN